MMKRDERQYWHTVHLKYAKRDWITKPTLFAKQVVKFIPQKGKLLDLGTGQGQDAFYFANQGYEVTGVDFSEYSIQQARKRLSTNHALSIFFEVMDLSQPLPYSQNSFDVIYSHLALHYFSKDRTRELFDEIFSILKPNGIIAALTNTVEDPEIVNLKKISEDYYATAEGLQKRFFSPETLAQYTKKFETIVLDSKGETYKDEIKTLIRFIGRKPAKDM